MNTDKTNKFDNCPCSEEVKENRGSVKLGMMKCMKGVKWFLLIPGILIIIAFLLGYFLDPATVRVLWLVITGALLAFGITIYILMNLWIRGLTKKSGVCSFSNQETSC